MTGLFDTTIANKNGTTQRIENCTFFKDRGYCMVSVPILPVYH